MSLHIGSVPRFMWTFPLCLWLQFNLLFSGIWLKFSFWLSSMVTGIPAKVIGYVDEQDPSLTMKHGMCTDYSCAFNSLSLRRVEKASHYIHFTLSYLFKQPRYYLKPLMPNHLCFPFCFYCPSMNWFIASISIYMRFYYQFWFNQCLML